MKFFKGSGYSFEELLSFDTPRLEALFPSHTTIDTDRLNELMLYFEGVNKARNHPGFTFLFHYQEYAQSVSDPYSYCNTPHFSDHWLS